MTEPFAAPDEANEPIPRDRWQRPLVVPPTGGKPVAYTRCTTYVGVLEDTFNLSKWQQRMTALGLASRPDLMMAVTSTDKDDKRALDKIVEQAVEAAAAHAAATIGTALHALTEKHDRGEQLPVIPETYRADMDAYIAATAHMKHVHIEQFCVQDPLKIGGTPDRVVDINGKKYIADLKTGSIEYGIGKIAMQLAVYARSKTYDHTTNTRGIHGAEIDKGIIIHLPAGAGTCTLYWVDLLEGWNGVVHAKNVRAWRAKKFKDLTDPYASDFPGAVKEPAQDGLTALINVAVDIDELTSLWADNQDTWTDQHTKLAAARKAALQASTTAA